jgi:hypothetical protein
MITRILKYIALVLSIFLWLEAYSPIVYREVTKAGIVPDDYRHGDLYRLSYLSAFKENRQPCATALPDSSRKKPIHLYIIGDSFTEPERVKAHDLKAEKYTYVHWTRTEQIQLDTTKTNILVVETVERTLKDHFAKPASNLILDSQNKQASSFSHPSWKRLIYHKTEEILAFVFPKMTEERLEHTLFNYDFFLWFRELKADFNLRYFDRTEPKVVISQNKKALFYFEEADASKITSAFYPVTNQEIDTFVASINQTEENYKNLGFDAVYVSLIPNKVSILDPTLGRYNHLIERIQTHSALKTPFIDTYNVFKKNPKAYYLKSDTHWNCTGQTFWLDQVNQHILQ